MEAKLGAPSISNDLAKACEITEKCFQAIDEELNFFKEGLKTEIKNFASGRFNHNLALAHMVQNNFFTSTQLLFFRQQLLEALKQIIDQEHVWSEMSRELEDGLNSLKMDFEPLTEAFVCAQRLVQVKRMAATLEEWVSEQVDGNLFETLPGGDIIKNFLLAKPFSEIIREEIINLLPGGKFFKKISSWQKHWENQKIEAPFYLEQSLEGILHNFTHILREEITLKVASLIYRWQEEAQAIPA
jgi:hypothetical protein